ncbi:Peptidoglycan-binding Lysin subgroup [Penicillium cataractarum]|uniref:chitinase n=1 Tax=Penicillium cataractarum TaxID=2100454 RepID=A0A9W9RPP5_9EURO|nr:Peptidoglycan-binding Lysin subgroup [Penicillium cataractarum]KAJ5364022.1 Peptidoglycan-binding Lysin subgroup [Penicillium cataractarum]
MRWHSLRSWALPAVSLASLFLVAQAGQDVNGKPVLKFGDAVPIDSPNTYYSDLHPCPQACLNSKPDSWTVYPSVERLAFCSQPMLFSMAIHNPVNVEGTTVKIRACTASTKSDADNTVNALFTNETAASRKITKRDKTEPGCQSFQPEETPVSLKFSQQGSNAGSLDDIAAVLDKLQGYLEQGSPCQDPPTLFGYSNGTVAGVYVGSSFDRKSLSSVTTALSQQVTTNGAADTMIAQLCGEKRNANHVFGIAIDTTGSIATVQNALVSWNRHGKCVDGLKSSATWDKVKVWESTVDLRPLVSNRNTTAHSTSQRNSSALHRRSDCTTITVVAGDGCDTLASRCGISGADFTIYNSADDTFCSNLVPNQRVCCTAGTLPDISPKPNADGSCATYLTTDNDNCDALAAEYGLTVDKLEEYNKGTTWGWNGCSNLFTGVNICLSSGTAPMPAPIDNAVCGPVKPGTVAISGVDLADLNPCPLNACCNIWGQCGVSADFCNPERGPDGNPGTSPPGTAGCISSCGTAVVKSDTPPAEYGRVGYYESWNFDRDCLFQRAINANTDGTYTHIHWSFANINTDDWTVVIDDPDNQWEQFKSLDVKRVVSFGGWSFSNDQPTYDILREAMSPANRATFAQNLANFLTSEGIDGIDFDWEYPGATDIPGTPAGQASDGPNYLKFLTTVRSKLPSGKTMSIAAPSSYWYLKNFPISSMANQLDYIVYMTYDLHVTKAGVPTNKIFVGESSYGRSFLMSFEGCTQPYCLFEGDWLNSPAAPGICTQEPGYIANAEIEEIIFEANNVKAWHDDASDSDIVVYDGVQWVAYMTDDTKTKRREVYRGYNFAGTIDWATDLQAFTEDEYQGPDGTEGTDQPAIPLADCNASYDSLDAIEADANNIPQECLSLYIVTQLKATLDDALGRYDQLLAGDYDQSFDIYAKAVVNSAGKQVDDFMAKHGNDYFTCEITEEIWCCDKCKGLGLTDTAECRYCQDWNCGWNSNCNHNTGGGEGTVTPCPNIESRWQNFTEPCAPDYSLRGETAPEAGYTWHEAIYWSLRDDKADQFWTDLYTNVGINKDNIKFGDKQYGECEPSDEHCWDHDYEHDYPIPVGYDKSDVINPKDIVSNARDKLNGLAPQLDDALRQMRNWLYLPSGDDLADAISLPVFMISDAVDSMEKIKDIADEIQEEQRKAIILGFLSALFFFIPVVGEVVGSFVELANIGRIISLVGATGNAALDIYTIVNDPANAPLAIFSLVLAPLAITDIVALSKAAGVRRGMSSDTLRAFGDVVNAKLDTITRIKNVCKA